jgi:hypothetical protein
MVDKEQLIRELALERLTPERQEEIVEQYTYALGDAMTNGLDEVQIEEFTQIINGNDEVIKRWLDEHAPDYRDDPSFQELEVGYEEDPEKVPADKVYASAAWVRLNRPDLEQVATRVKNELKASLADQPS